MKAFNILVTGIASDIGYNCGRILREMNGLGTLHGCDIDADHPGRLLFDRCDVAPRALDQHYLTWLEDQIQKHEIDYLLPTSEAEISAIAGANIDHQLSAKVMITNRRVIENSLDKHLCLNFLECEGIPVPAHGLVGSDAPVKWPVMVKPRSGQGSKELQLFTNSEDYSRLAPIDFVWQEQLLPASEEYTCAVYRTPVAGLRIMQMRRTLMGGLTHKGEIARDPDIFTYVASIAEAMDLDGVMNVQLRRTQSGPLLFEINPRLSSTVMFRHRLGFRDLEWWLMELMGQKIGGYEAVADGTRFYRGAQEYIVMPT